MQTDVLSVLVKKKEPFWAAGYDFHFLGQLQVVGALGAVADCKPVCPLHAFIVDLADISWRKFIDYHTDRADLDEAVERRRCRYLWFNPAECLDTLAASELYLMGHPCGMPFEGIEKFILQDIRCLAGLLRILGEQEAFFCLAFRPVADQPEVLRTWFKKRQAEIEKERRAGKEKAE